MNDHYALNQPPTDFDHLPQLGDNPYARPTRYCEAPIDFYPPLASEPIPLVCKLGKGHANDHLAIFGSADHDPPISIELRWSQT